MTTTGDALRVLVLCRRGPQHPRAGGSEAVIDALATGLTGRGHDVTVLSARPVPSRPYRTEANGGDYTQYLRAPFAWRRHHRDADVVVDVADGLPFLPPWWSDRPSVAVVNHLHTVQWAQWFSPPVAAAGRMVETTLMPRAYRRHLVVASCPSVRDTLLALGTRPETTRVITAGADAADAPGSDDDEPLFVAVAQLLPDQRLDLLLRLWERVRPHTGGHLVIVGDGPERSRLTRLAGPRVELVANLDPAAVDALLARAWVLLHPAMTDGWSVAVRRAAAQGTPTVGFDVPGVRDAVTEETGVVADSEAAFVDAWVTIGTDAGTRERLGKGAWSRAQAHPWARSVAAFEAVLQEAVGRAGRPVARPTTTDPADDWRPAPTDRAMARVADWMERRAPADADPLSQRELFRRFLREKHDPAPFYRGLAQRSIRDLGHPVEGRRILDLGCGRGYYTDVLRQQGARAVGVDLHVSSPLRERVLESDEGTVARPPTRPDASADAGRLPFPDATFDGILCSNLLEHTPDVDRIFDELERVLRPGAWAWVSWTNWYSPWGGHDITPLHYLGPDRGLRAWRRLYGEPRTNVPFEGLWPTHIGPTLRALRRHPGLEIQDVHPRYYPSQRWIVAVPGLREVLTWNCVIRIERRPVAAGRS